MVVATGAATACAPPREPVLADGPIAAPAHGDVAGSTCLDVGEGRACWGERCSEGCVVPPERVVAPRPYGGFRCSGSGETRTCVARSRHAGRFRCDGNACRQPHPRSPDAGEWECVDLHGAYVCRSVAEAAGIPRGPRDPAFVCGARRGTGEPICVDFAPDLPEGPGPYACTMRYVSGVAERVCTRKAGAVLGTRCRAEADCPEGARCVSSRCLPPEPHPDCWFDKDCAADGRCRFGSCT
jgi:hypothetical protein